MRLIYCILLILFVQSADAKQWSLRHGATGAYPTKELACNATALCTNCPGSTHDASIDGCRYDAACGDPGGACPDGSEYLSVGFYGGYCAGTWQWDLNQDGSVANGTPTCLSTIPTCDAGEPFNDYTGHCDSNCFENTPDEDTGICIPPPVECNAGEVESSITVGGVTTNHCTIPLPGATEPPDECENIVGYFNNQQVCADNSDSCSATGGTFGLVDGVETCIPDDYADDLPTCDSGGVVVLVEGGFSCESPSSPSDPNNPNVPNSNPANETDTDGDGTPNSNDSDIDGDGLNNSVDTDDDGDGVLDVDDETPSGEPTETEVNGGGSCGTRPSCSGDAIQCAILYQSWATRCESGKDNPKVSGGGDCNTAPSCEDGAWQCALVTQMWNTRCQGDSQTDIDALTTGLDPTGIDLGTTDLQTTLTGIYSQTGASASCPADDQISVQGITLSISYTPFCDLAGLIRPVVLLLFSLIAFRTVMRAF